MRFYLRRRIVGQEMKTPEEHNSAVFGAQPHSSAYEPGTRRADLSRYEWQRKHAVALMHSVYRNVDDRAVSSRRWRWAGATTAEQDNLIVLPNGAPRMNQTGPAFAQPTFKSSTC